MATEGDAHRGDKFAAVANSLDVTRFYSSVRITEIEVFSFLGLPDCGRATDKDMCYVYSYNRTETKSRWVAIVFIRDGQLKEIGWNDASVNDFSTWKHYQKWSDVLGPAK
jgi:hypothetical protein